MQLLALLVLACVAMAAFQAAAKLLAAAILLAIVVGFVSNPREFATSLIGLAAFGLLTRFPLVGAIVVGALLILGFMARNRR